jgi:hypothetical protein
VSLVPHRACLAALALAVALVPVGARPADAAINKHRRHHTAHTSARPTVRATAQPVVSSPTPAPAPTPATTSSVIAIGGYVFYDLTYAQAVAAYQALVAAAPPGSAPPAVTSVSVTTTAGGTA